MEGCIISHNSTFLLDWPCSFFSHRQISINGSILLTVGRGIIRAYPVPVASLFPPGSIPAEISKSEDRRKDGARSGRYTSPETLPSCSQDMQNQRTPAKTKTLQLPAQQKMSRKTPRREKSDNASKEGRWWFPGFLLQKFYKEALPRSLWGVRQRNIGSMANPKKYPPCILKRFSMNSIEYPPEKIDNHTSSLPSGKLTYSYVKSPSLIGKSTTNYKCAIFYSYVKLQEGTAI